MKKTLGEIYRVNQIRSNRAVQREKLDPRTIEKHVGDFETIEQALRAYDNTSTGMETGKEIVVIETDEVILTTYRQ